MVVDIDSGYINWVINGKESLFEVLPAEMRNAPLYISIAFHDIGDSIEIVK